MRDIPGYEGLYAASYAGHIWAHERRWVAHRGGARSYPGRWLRERPNNCGYQRVRLLRRYVLVHRLVALAWLPNPLNLPEVNHDNLNKGDNAASNLEWSTTLANMAHASAAGRMISVSRKLTMEQAADIRRRHARGESSSVLGEAFKLDRKGIWDIVNGNTYRQ